MLKRGSFSQKRALKSASEDVNPMHYLGNLADAMLVLAVGIMLAVVIAWQVDISDVQDSGSEPAAAVEITDEVESLETTTNESEDGVSIEDFGLTEFGKVYVDENGNYYVIEEN